MSIRSRLDRIRSDDGLTLPELLVVSIVTTMLLIAVGGIYISTLTAQRTVSQLTQGSNSAQLVARSIDSGVRNAVFFGGTPVRTDASGNQLLVACTAGSATPIQYSWTAWYYSPSGRGELRMHQFAANAEPGMPTATAASGWTLLLTGVSPRGAGGAVFGFDAAKPSEVSIHFAAVGENADSASIDFSSHLAPAPTYAPGTEPCT